MPSRYSAYFRVARKSPDVKCFSIQREVEGILSSGKAA
jgi:hypothetical protein